MKLILHHLVIVISIVFFFAISGVDGEQCRRKDPNGNDDFFSCPRLFESSKKKYCCGTTLQDKHCCEWSKKIRDGPTPEVVKQFFESAVAIIILVLLIIGGLIICCCVVCCCVLSRKRQQRGRVLGNSENGTSVTTVQSHPNSVSYPVQPNTYPMHNVTAPYPMEQPPPYTFNHQTQPPYNPSYPIK